MSVDTKRFKLHKTEIEFDTYYPSQYVFNTISDPLVKSAFEIATERGFYIEKLIKITKLHINLNATEADVSAALRHVIFYKFIGATVLINTEAIEDDNENIDSIIDRCELLELNKFRHYSVLEDEYHNSRNYILADNNSRLIIREIISDEI